MKQTLNREEVIDFIRREAEKHGGQAEFARAAGVGKQHVTDIMKGRRPPGDQVCAYLGLERQTVFVRTKNRISAKA